MPASVLPPLHEWETFYVILGSSAAALTGLMFVVIALRADSRAANDGGALRALATPTVVHFCAVLVLVGASALLLVLIGIHNAWDSALRLSAKKPPA